MTEPTKPQFSKAQWAKPLTARDIPGLMKAVADVVRPLQARVAELEQRAELKYSGVFEAGRAYVKGSFVTDHGSLWHANRATMSRPGEGSGDWTLAVKKGRDADERRVAKSHR